MGVVVWNTWTHLAELREHLEHFMRESSPEQLATGRGADCGYVWRPSADVYETAEGFTILLELPGVAKDAIAVECQDNVLRVYGERRFERDSRDPEGGRYLAVERCHGPFARQFQLPRNVDEAGVVASLDDGVLTLTVPKAKPVNVRKRIEVE